MRISDWSSDVCSSDLLRPRLRLRVGWLKVNRLLLPAVRFDRGEAEVLEVEAEVGEFGGGDHAGFADVAVGVQRKAEEGVGVEPALVPADQAGVVLPVLQRADQVGGAGDRKIVGRERGCQSVWISVVGESLKKTKSKTKT